MQTFSKPLDPTLSVIPVHNEPGNIAGLLTAAWAEPLVAVGVHTTAFHIRQSGTSRHAEQEPS